MASTLPILARTALLTALVGGFALAVPTAVRAQSVTPERAFLNRLDPTPGGTVTAFTQVQAASARVDQGFLDGERALLNRFRATDGQVVTQSETARPGLATARDADGVKALLNRSSL